MSYHQSDDVRIERPRASGAVERPEGQRRGQRPGRARSEARAPDQGSKAAEQDRRAGLVRCTISSRECSSARSSVSNGALLSDLRGGFPTASEMDRVANLFGSQSWDGREGPVSMIQFSPGSVRLMKVDLNRAERRLNRQANDRVRVDSLADQVRQELRQGDRDVVTDADLDPEPAQLDSLKAVATRGAITGWSRRSRSLMVRRLSELDYRPLFGDFTEMPAMVTLTYPGDWESVAPDAASVKRHLEMFCKRFERAWSQTWVGLWKMEFQRRGAPHLHLFMVPPRGRAGDVARDQYRDRLAQWRADLVGRKPYPPRTVFADKEYFRQWLSLTWADIVNSEDRDSHIAAGTGIDYPAAFRASDPKRLAVYFSKHGAFKAKDYQNQVPKLWRDSGGSGRFWGYRGLKPLVRTVLISPADQVLLARALRKLAARRRYWDEDLHQYRWVKAMREVRVPRRKVWAESVEVAEMLDDSSLIRFQPERDDEGRIQYDSVQPGADPLKREMIPKRRYRRSKKPLRLFANTSGFVVTNSGLNLAQKLAGMLQSSGTG